MLRRLPIRLKLLLLAGVPVLGALILATLISRDAQRRAQSAAALGSIEDLARLSAHMSKLVQELQFERSELALRLGTKTTDTDELQKRFDNDKYSRSYYPGAPIPHQENILLENVRVLYDAPTDFLQVRTPIDVVSIANSSLRNNHIVFSSNKAMTDYGPTRMNMTGCIFAEPGTLQLLINRVPGKKITFKTAGSLELSDNFSAVVVEGSGNVTVESDLMGLHK